MGEGDAGRGGGGTDESGWWPRLRALLGLPEWSAADEADRAADERLAATAAAFGWHLHPLAH